MRKRYLFSGQVQGVGFRETTRRIAGRHAVAGIVRNLNDGRVELVADGEPEAMGAFVQEIQEAMADYIRDTAAETIMPNEPMAGFRVLR